MSKITEAKSYSVLRDFHRKWRLAFAPSFDVSNHLGDDAYWESLAAKLREDILAGRDSIYEARHRLGVQPFLHPPMRALSDEEPGEAPLDTAKRLGHYSEEKGWSP